MRLRIALVPAFAITCLTSATVPACAAPESFDRVAYLAQAAKAGPDEIVARNFLATAAAPSRFFDEGSLAGPAAPAVVAWLGNAHEHCTPPGTEIELECRTRGLVDAAQMVHVDSADGTRGWAVVTLHTSPDDGNVGYERIVLFRKGHDGYAFDAVADARGYQLGNFADDEGTMTYVGFTGTPGEALEGEGPRQRYRIVGEGVSAEVVEDGPAQPRRSAPSTMDDTSDEAAAVATVTAIYRGPHVFGAMGSKDPAAWRPYFTPALIEAWFHPAPDAAYDGDGDPLTWTQMTDSVSIVSATPHDFEGDRGIIRVSARAVVEDVPRMVSVEWVLRKVGGRWLADDDRSIGRSLRAELAPMPTRPRATESGRNGHARLPASTTAGGGPGAYVADHNGSLVTVSPSLGIIAYVHPRLGMDRLVGTGTVLFRGRITDEGVVGTAYTFKRGCAPAPYAVSGFGHAGSGGGFVLTGHPPIRAPHSCAVVGYGDNGNSVLHFERAGSRRA